jgi:pimeloyl-ACP methyl ester carboxylesterase
MPDAPATRFARNGDVHLAYQVVGDGPVDLLFVDDWVHHVEVVWEVPEYARFLRRLASFSRLIHFDRRGTGLSDPVPADQLPDLETQVADVIAILDAAGSERPAVFGVQVGSLIAMLLAATHPERCRQLVLYAPSAMAADAPDNPMREMFPSIDVVVDTMARDMAEGGEAMIPGLAPSRADDARFIAQLARLSRSAVRPGTIAHFFRQSLQTDLRDVLPAIAVPTLVLHRTEDPVFPVELGRQVASLIPGATLHELDGGDHLLFTGDSDAILDEIEEFVTGSRTGAEPDRVLATLLFTDIVDSTRTAAELGDRRWHDLLDEHRVLVRRDFERFRGRELATTGDGFLASFDGPARAVRCGQSIVRAATELGLAVRAGVHAGEFDLRGNDASGLTVHIASRVADLAGAGEVLTSSTVKDLLAGSGIDFEPRGEHELKGVPDTWRLFAASRA